MTSKMSSSIPIRLLICIVVFIPWCFRGCGIGYVMSSRSIQHDDFKNTEYSTRFQYLNIQDLEDSITSGIEELNFDTNFEDLLSNAGLHVKIGSPAYGQFIDSKPSVEGHLESRNAEIAIKASSHLLNSYCSKHIFGDLLACSKQLTKIKLDKTSLGEKCLSMYHNQTACDGKNLKYRTIDGSCNNLKRSFLGKANTAYKRLLFPDYNNGLSDLKKLPNPRKLSKSLVDDVNSPDSTRTIAMAYWATFISHDLSKTAVSMMLKTNKSVICCPEDGRLEVPKLRHRACQPITIPENDELNTSPIGEGCMNYVRSMPAMRTDCTFGPREQANVVTHYLDGSMIYGSSVQETWSLRSKSRGQLLTFADGRPHYMPAYMPLDNSNTCQFGPGTCYRAGDSRANAQPQLMLMHTLWLREHNRLADELASMNRRWDDERTFQEARKIVTASIQHITYNEWLPALLDRNYAMRSKLELLSNGYSDAYDETADPSVSNGFATAVLPFVNSMYDETISLYSENRVTNRNLSLRERYNRPSGLLTLYVDNLIMGLSTQSTQKVDMTFSKTMTNYLFNINLDNTFGMDVMSLAIQRSRDHGIPSYVEYRKYCGLKEVSNRRDLNSVMVEGAVFRLMEQYKEVKDIELLIGALFEKHEGDSMVGPTMRCIIKEQFIRTRIADRYFYDLPKVFSERQLAEIRKMSLARLLCDNDDYDIKTMQKQVFFKPGSGNELLPCNSISIPKININHWSE